MKTVHLQRCVTTLSDMQQELGIGPRKVCLGCQKDLPEDDFAPVKRTGRRQARCRPCVKAYLKKWHSDRPGYSSEKAQEWVARNAERWESYQASQRKRRGPSLSDERRELARQQLAGRAADLKPHSVADGVDKVYFIQEGEDGPIKIGYTGQALLSRLHGLQNGNPRALLLRGVIAGDRDTEGEVHAAFGHLTMPGTNEWFRPADDLLEFISTVAVVPKTKASRAGYRGVQPINQGRQYAARFNPGTGDMYLGCFATAKEAADAYDAKAREVLGAAALLNTPGPGERHWSEGKGRRSAAV